MTDKELVERLNAYSAQYQNHGGITAEAADRIEQLCAELTNEKIDNTNLIGELATVAAERDRYKADRDAAVNDLIHAHSSGKKACLARPCVCFQSRFGQSGPVARSAAALL